MHLLNMMELEIRSEEQLQESNVEEIPTNGVMLSDRIPKRDSLVIHRPVNPLLIEQVREVLVQKIH